MRMTDSSQRQALAGMSTKEGTAFCSSFAPFFFLKAAFQARMREAPAQPRARWVAAGSRHCCRCLGGSPVPWWPHPHFLDPH